MQAKTNSIFTKILSALASSMGARIGIMGMHFLLLSLLPLWLTPVALGQLALFFVFVNLPIILIDLGLGTALVKEPELAPVSTVSVHWLSLVSSFVMSVVLLLLAPALGRCLGLPEPLFSLAALALIPTALAVVPNALLAKDLRFLSLALRDLFGEVLFVCISLLGLFGGYGLWAVAVAVVLQRWMRFVVARWALDWKPSFHFSLRALSPLWRFALAQFATLSLNQLFMQLDKLLLGLLLNRGQLGYYAQAQQLSTQPMQSLLGAVNNVFFASFSKFQAEFPTLQQLFLKIARAYFWISAGLVALAYPAAKGIVYVYGQDWLESMEVARILLLALPLFAASFLEGIMIAIGGERRRVVAMALRLFIMVGAVLGLAYFWPEGLSARSLARILILATAASVCVNASFVLRRLELRPAHYRSLLGHAAAAALAALSALYLGQSIFG